jgi:hypothetical protein
MNENEIRLIKDLYKHYDESQEVNDEFLKYLYENYGSIRSVLKNVILKYDLDAEINDEYIDTKLKQYGIDLSKSNKQNNTKEPEVAEVVSIEKKADTEEKLPKAITSPKKKYEIDLNKVNIQKDVKETKGDTEEKLPKADQSSKKKKPNYKNMAIITASIVVIAIAVFFFLTRNNSITPETDVKRNLDNVESVTTKSSERYLNNVEIELLEYICVDNCYIIFKQVSNPEITYDYHNFESLNIPGKEYIREIRDEYDRYGEKSSLIGKKYFVNLELKNVKDWEETEYGPKDNGSFVDKWIITSIKMKPTSKDILNNKKENDIANENSFTPFNIKIKDGKKYINIRKAPVNGSVVGKVSEKENYTVSQEYKSDNPLYLLNKKMILKDVKSGEEVEKPKSFKLNNVVSIDKYTYKAEVINLDKTTNKVYIQKSDVDVSYSTWYYLKELNGWIYSEFCEKLN